MRWLWALLWIAACGDNCHPPPDAQDYPPCVSLGCPSALCNSVGQCVCDGRRCHAP